MKVLVLIQAVLLVALGVAFGFHYGNTAARISSLESKLSQVTDELAITASASASATEQAIRSQAEASTLRIETESARAKQSTAERALSASQESLAMATTEVARLRAELLALQAESSAEVDVPPPAPSTGAGKFFAMPVTGSRVAFVVDVSGSMRGLKLAALKHQLLDVVSSLPNGSRFAIVPFQSNAVSLGNRHGWVESSTNGKRWCTEHVNSLEASGGTEPWPAFDIVFSLTPAPDAIYFMTDGVFDPGVVDQVIAKSKAGKGRPIHCITLIDKSAEDLMRRIASATGGVYLHVASVP